jgi:NAD(P)-dependent dehydrogenase (short-subunit alcohol dehydrogenase family)
MDLGIKGKRALVSGGSSGIGLACAVELAREGVVVCIVGRDQTRLAEAAALTAQAGTEGFAVAADLSTAEGCHQAYDACAQSLGGVDIFISSAGAAQPAPLLQLDPKRIDEALGLKLYSALRLSQLVVPGMRAQKWGRIVYIAGAGGTNPEPETLPVSFANITMMNLTRAMSDEVSGDGILLNVICPGRVNTPRTWARHQAQALREGKSMEAFLDEEGRTLPAGRIAESEEVARVAAFLSSEPCSYVFASAIYMDGGKRRGTP